jgi:hypothetical protein
LPVDWAYCGMPIWNAAWNAIHAEFFKFNKSSYN